MGVRPVNFFINIARNFSTKPTTNGDIMPYIYNRNPRNLERMRIDRKPTGYFLDNIFVEFWHKLEIKPKSNYVCAQLIHNSKKVVVEASTNEWAIYKHLYSKKDRLAYKTLAHVFAERCLESGITSFACNFEVKKDSKLELFLWILKEEDLILHEASEFKIHDIWYLKREKRPWTVLED